MNAIILEIAAWLALGRAAPVRIGQNAIRLNPAHVPARRAEPVARAVVRQQPFSRRLMSRRGPSNKVGRF